MKVLRVVLAGALFASLSCNSNAPEPEPADDTDGFRALPPARTAAREMVDSGDDPTSPGCAVAYVPFTECGEVNFYFADRCTSATELREAVVGENVGCWAYRQLSKTYNCDTYCKDNGLPLGGSCVTDEGFCAAESVFGSVNSAHCLCKTNPDEDAGPEDAGAPEDAAPEDAAPEDAGTPEDAGAPEDAG